MSPDERNVMSVSEWNQRISSATSRFDKEINDGVRVNDIKAGKARFISKAGVYELIMYVDSINNGNASIIGDSDAGEGCRFVHYLTNNNDISVSGWYHLFKAMGMQELRMSMSFLKEVFGVENLIAALQDSFKLKFRCSVKAYWKKGSIHAGYVQKGQYTLFNENEEVHLVDGYDVTAGSREELESYCESKGIKLDKWIQWQLLENIIPIEENTSQVTQAKPQQAPKPKSFSLPKPVVTEQPQEQVGGDVPF